MKLKKILVVSREQNMKGLLRKCNTLQASGKNTLMLYIAV